MNGLVFDGYYKSATFTGKGYITVDRMQTIDERISIDSQLLCSGTREKQSEWLQLVPLLASSTVVGILQRLNFYHDCWHHACYFVAGEVEAEHKKVARGNGR